MSIPFEVVRARGQFRAGKITAAEFNKIAWDAGYLRPRDPPAVFDGEAGTYSDPQCSTCKPFRSLAEITAAMMEKLR